MRLKLPLYTTVLDDLGSREPLLFIHGFPLSRALWEPQLNDLSDSARVLAFDVADRAAVAQALEADIGQHLKRIHYLRGRLAAES